MVRPSFLVNSVIAGFCDAAGVRDARGYVPLSPTLSTDGGESRVNNYLSRHRWAMVAIRS